MSKARVSILLPTYNRAHLIGQAIETLLSQTFRDFVLLVYDDGSEDETVQIVRAYEDPRICLLRDPQNQGFPTAMNCLMQVADTEYAAMMGSDDLCNAHRLALQIEELERTYAAAVVTSFQWTHKMRDPLDWQRDPVGQMASKDLCHGSVMFRSERAVPLDVAMSLGGSDADWLARMRKQAGGVVWLKKVLYYVRRHKERMNTWRKLPGANPAWRARMEEVARRAQEGGRI